MSKSVSVVNVLVFVLLLLGLVYRLTTVRNRNPLLGFGGHGFGGARPSGPQDDGRGGGDSGTEAQAQAQAPPPPPSWPCVSAEETVTRELLIFLLGCVISVLSYSNPLIVYWSLGGSGLETITFHSFWDLMATTASCLAWLLFAVTHLHIEGNKVSGLEVVLINLMGTTVYTFYTIIKMVAGAANFNDKGCIGAIAALCGPAFITLYFIGFGPIKNSNSLAVIWVTFGATLLQVFSQFLPFRSFYLLCYPPADAPAQHVNTKKLIIYSRGCNLIVCVYWAIYCDFSYKHRYFEFANIVAAILAFITFKLHLIYALEPQEAVGVEKKQMTRTKEAY